MANFEVLIISLAGDHIRKRFQEDQTKNLGLKAKFMDAATPDNLPTGLLEKFSSAWARPLRTTEVALTHSHLLAWQNVVKTEKPTLILEDDAVLCSSISAVLDVLSSKSDLELVQLETFNVPKLVHKKPEYLNIAEYQIRKLYRDRGGAAAYFLWPKAAKKLIASVERCYPPADAAIHLAPGIVRHQIIPACAIQAMNVSKDSVYFEKLVDIAPSSVGLVSKPGYESKVQWLKHKARRLAISFVLFKRIIVAFRSGEYKTVHFTSS